MMKMDMIISIIYNMKTNFKILYYNIKNGLKNFWLWKSIIWNDRNWDYVYLLKILEFKLNLMSEEMKKSSIPENRIKVSSELKRAAILVKLLSEETNFEIKKFFKDHNIESFEELENEEYKEGFLKAYEEDKKNRKYLERKLFKILKNYRRWWD